jgi:hypothetical protein
MPRVCTVCAHEDAFEINEAIVGVGGQKSNRAIARQYDLHHDAVRRHKDHIPELLVQASQDRQGYEADAILSRIEDLERETLEQLEAAKTDEDLDRRVILQAIREQRGNIELVAKVKQLIDQAPKVEVLIAPQVQQVIIDSLHPFPEARLAVATALGALEEASAS